MGIHRSYSGTLTRATSDSTGSQAVTGAGGKFIDMAIMGSDNASSTNAGDGWTDGVIQSCTFSSGITILSLLASQNGCDMTKCMTIKDINSNGWTISISSKDVDGFTISWGKLGSGLNVTVKYLLTL